MKRIKLLLTTSLLLGLLIMPDALAQPRMGRGGEGWGMGGPYQRLYDPQTIETVTGEVVAVDRITSPQGMSGGVHLRMQTADQEEVSVRLGPGWYLDNQELQVEVGDTITVRGSSVIVSDQPVLIAAEVQKGDQILQLRDDQGFPMWSDWSRQQRFHNRSFGCC